MIVEDLEIVVYFDVKYQNLQIVKKAADFMKNHPEYMYVTEFTRKVSYNEETAVATELEALAIAEGKLRDELNEKLQKIDDRRQELRALKAPEPTINDGIIAEGTIRDDNEPEIF